jgi:hypothetical protein
MLQKMVILKRKIQPMQNKNLLLLILLLFPFLMLAQQKTELSDNEDSLISLARIILNAPEENVRFEAAKHFETLFSSTLELPDSWDYPFDSLQSVSKLVAGDKAFRIFTWSVPRQNGTYDYAGILQVRTDKKKCRLYLLNDVSAEIKKPEEAVLSPDKWYGALYYKLITTRSGDKYTYTLLGWDACSVQTRRKVIEVLSFTKSGEPVFGASVFTRFPRKVKRVIFEHAAKVSMSLTYSEQGIKIKSGKKGKQASYKVIKKEMIVFDRLVPQDPQLEGIYAYYVPETNINDGFVFDNGRWQFVKEVDARNPERDEKSIPKSRKEQQLFPPATPKK